MADKTFTLNTGAKIPALGLGMLKSPAKENPPHLITPQGTWQSAPGEVAKAVEHALRVGYKHIDAAYCYGNEDEVGAGIAVAIKAGVVKREELWVTTKLWCTYHTRVEENLDMSLKSLGLDYVDLYLMHWPVAMNPNGNAHRD
jgi:glycerol 2-dehydrogenase (NADP+)